MKPILQSTHLQVPQIVFSKVLGCPMPPIHKSSKHLIGNEAAKGFTYLFCFRLLDLSNKPFKHPKTIQNSNKHQKHKKLMNQLSKTLENHIKPQKTSEKKHQKCLGHTTKKLTTWPSPHPHAHPVCESALQSGGQDHRTRTLLVKGEGGLVFCDLFFAP